MKYSFQPQYEMLKFKDGTIVFNNYFGKHQSLKKPHEQAFEFLKRLDGETDLDTILEELDGKIKKSYALSLVSALTKKGVLVEEGNDLEGIDPKERKRFEAFIKFLSQFDEAVGYKSGLRAFKNLRNAHVTVLGLGGTGSFCAMMLAAIGVGKIRLIDGDLVEESNLVRQIFFQEKECENTYKVDAMANRISELTKYTEVQAINSFVSSQKQAKEILAGTDFLILAADAPRFILNRWVNEACCELKLPYVSAFNGAVGPLFVPGKTPCFACLETHLRQVTGDQYDMMVDALQVTLRRRYPSFVSNVVLTAEAQFFEAIAHITGILKPRSLDGLLRFGQEGRSIEKVQRSPNCPQCGAL